MSRPPRFCGHDAIFWRELNLIENSANQTLSYSNCRKFLVRLAGLECQRYPYMFPPLPFLENTESAPYLRTSTIIRRPVLPDSFRTCSLHYGIASSSNQLLSSEPRSCDLAFWKTSFIGYYWPRPVHSVSTTLP